VTKERPTSAVLLLVAAAGTAIGLARFKVWALIPGAVGFALLTIAVGIALGVRWSATIFTLIAGLTLFELCYLAGIAAAGLPKPRPPPQRVLMNEEQLHAIEIAIGEGLHDHFRLPTDQPRELRAKLARLEAVTQCH
jgi:hypothetical protein